MSIDLFCFDNCHFIQNSVAVGVVAGLVMWIWFVATVLRKHCLVEAIFGGIVVLGPIMFLSVFAGLLYVVTIPAGLLMAAKLLRSASIK